MYIIGLDLGQRADFSAVVIAETALRKSAEWRYSAGPRYVYLTSMTPDNALAAIASGEYEEVKPSDKSWALNVLHVDRWLIGTPYPAIVKDVVLLFEALRIGPQIRVALIVDATGVGRPVIDMFRDRGLNPVEITITGIGDASRVERGYNVPKRDLVMSSVAMLESDRLRWPAGDDAMINALQTELKAFQMKHSKAGNELYEAERRAHDDLVMALSMTCWASQSGAAFGPQRARVREY